MVGRRPTGCAPEQAASAIAPRGPDGGATWSDDTLLLVASRLAHWEEGSPWQPFTDGQGAGAFNGELFNLTELQELLGRPGISEIEALLVGLRTHGTDFLRHVDGQFAVIARPVEGGPVILARDRFGIAPLYWARTDGAVVAASNLAALDALRPEPERLDPEGLAAVMADWAASGDRTPWTGVAQVRPGHALLVDTDLQVEDVRWDDRGGDRPTSDGADLADLEAALRHAVRIRLRSTGEVVCLISGGIDSTVIGAFARDEGVRRGLSLCLEGDDLVRERQQQVADALDMSLVQHTLTPASVVDTWEHYVRTRRIPLMRLGPVGMTALARRAWDEGIRGVLSGEGADELFAGYDSYRILAARAGLFGDPKSLPWREFGTPEFGADRGPRWAASYWRGLIAFSTSAGARRLDILGPVAPFFRTPYAEIVRGETPLPDTADPALPISPDPLEARRQVDITRLLAGYLLTVQGDHAWMEEGVELRPPFLASPVADWALGTPVPDMVAVHEGKRPIRALLPRLAEHRPALRDLGFAKAAFRVDVGFVLRDPAQFDRLVTHAEHAPEDILDVEALLDRMRRIRDLGSCSEAESQLITLAVSLSLLET